MFCSADAAVVSSLDFITSLISSCVIFSVLGYLAEELGVDVSNVAEGEFFKLI